MSVRAKLDNLGLLLFACANIYTLMQFIEELAITLAFPLFYCAIYLPLCVIYKSIRSFQFNKDSAIKDSQKE